MLSNRHARVNGHPSGVPACAMSWQSDTRQPSTLTKRPDPSRIPTDSCLSEGRRMEDRLPIIRPGRVALLTMAVRGTRKRCGQDCLASTRTPGAQSYRFLVMSTKLPQNGPLSSQAGPSVLAGQMRAGGGVLVDVDGNHLIDFGSGIAVTSVGNAAPAVVRRVQDQVADFTHTCFMVTPYSGYVEVCEALNRLTPGDHAKRSALFNSCLLYTSPSPRD